MNSKSNLCPTEIPTLWKDLKTFHDQVRAKYHTLQKDAPKKNRNEHLAEFVRFVYLDMIRHFQLEEELMNHTDYPSQENHRQEHHRFLNLLADIQTQLETHGVKQEVGTGLVALVGEWLSIHEPHYDEPLDEFLTSQYAMK
ncbi:MAG: hemerythrin family protein [Deltaproteobacteria bacterium]|nr:hemerythrin family protein [Deltaproteobacteria bacterium]